VATTIGACSTLSAGRCVKVPSRRITVSCFLNRLNSEASHSRNYSAMCCSRFILVQNKAKRTKYRKHSFLQPGRLVFDLTTKRVWVVFLLIALSKEKRHCLSNAKKRSAWPRGFPSNLLILE